MDQTPVSKGRVVPSKRKAEDKGVAKKNEAKKSKPTFTPTAATRSLKRTTAARSKAIGGATQPLNMTDASGHEEVGPAVKKQTGELFKDLDKSLSNSITGKISEDFKQTFTIVGEKVAKNE